MISKNITYLSGYSFAKKWRPMNYLQTGLCLLLGIACYRSAWALKVEPGVGAGVEYTDNVRLTSNNKQSDTIGVAYVGANIEQKSGALRANANTTLNYQHYSQNTFSDQHYFNLNGLMDWEMVKNQFHLLLRDNFSQRTVNSLGTNVPNNLQDTNVFTFGANWDIQLSARNKLTLLPEYRQFYYEVQATDNKQISLAANWSYLMYPLLNVGLNASVRKIDYNQTSIADTRFSTLHVNFSGKRPQSSYSLNLGATHVSRDTGQGNTGFSGSFNGQLNFTNTSKLQARLSTELTDSSSGSLNTINDPSAGDVNNVQITTDVIRNKLFRLAYLREDGSLNSQLWTQLREVLYSQSPNDRRISSLGIDLNYPLTDLLSGRFYTYYDRNRLLQQSRTDKTVSAGLGLSYHHSRKLRSVLDIKYRNRNSTGALSDYSSSSIFYSLIYGFGQVRAPTLTGGY